MDQTNDILPNWLRKKAIEYVKKVTGVQRPVKEHAPLIRAWEECYKSLVSFDEKIKFDLEKALMIAKGSIVGNPLYSKVKDEEKLLELMVLSRALGMRDQYKLDQTLLSEIKRKKHGKKESKS